MNIYRSNLYFLLFPAAEKVTKTPPLRKKIAKNGFIALKELNSPPRVSDAIKLPNPSRETKKLLAAQTAILS
jgi:hypothetical protein